MKKQSGDTKKPSLEDELDVFEEFEVEKEGPKAKEKKPAASETARAAEEFDLSLSDAEDTDTEKMSPKDPPASSRSDETAPRVGEPAASALAKELLELAPDVPVNVVAVIGKIPTNVGDLMKLKMGSVVSFNRPPSEIVDIVANGRLIARGELVEVDGKLGVKVIKLLR
jgi:type III secretion system YscQ/HrcQ family protein